MKKAILTILISFLSYFTYSQVPELISYRAIAINSSGSALSNQHIKIKVSILDNTMSALFEESHDINTTDSNGAYNLQIGASSIPLAGATNISGVFNTINWGNGNKYLKIEIDPTGIGSSYPLLVGTTQLLSVPYALLAKDVMNVPANGVATLQNINDLRNYNEYADNKVIYIKGYYSAGDGGEGFFVYKPAETLADNHGIIIKPASVSGNGRWIRQYSGYINVNYFGVIRDWLPSGFSNSDRIQKIIDFTEHLSSSPSNGWSNRLSDMTIQFPNGSYFIDKPLILKDRVKIVGGAATIFTVNPGASYDYMIKINSGPIVNCEIDNLLLNLNNNNNIGGIYLKGVGTPSGGIWLSKFKNINIINLKGNGIHLEGGNASSNYLLPNQFLIFENVRVVRSDENYNSLRITGQQGQITFLNCTFDVNNGMVSKGVNVFIGKANVNDLGAAVISFINSTIQSSEYGVRMDAAENITFDNCWFEDLDIAIDIKDSKGINILNSRFANAAGFGGGPNSMIPAGYGRCISSENSFVTIENNYITVTDPSSSLAKDDKFILGVGNNNVINVKDNTFQDIGLSTTFGIVQATTIVSNAIDITSKKLIFINSSGTINRINSSVLAGETIFIRANSGNVVLSQMDSSGLLNKNIYLNGRLSLTLTPGQGATFIKLDNVVGNEKATYQLVSIAN